ncbi:unnamed protein product [Brassica oleracea]
MSRLQIMSSLPISALLNMDQPQVHRFLLLDWLLGLLLLDPGLVKVQLRVKLSKVSQDNLRQKKKYEAQPPTPPPVPPPASPQTPPLAPDATSEAATRSASGATGVTDEATRHACSAITLLLLPHRSFFFFTLQAGSAHESRATTTSANSSSINLLCLFYHYAEKLRWRPARRPENIQKK